MGIVSSYVNSLRGAHLWRGRGSFNHMTRCSRQCSGCDIHYRTGMRLLAARSPICASQCKTVKSVGGLERGTVAHELLEIQTKASIISRPRVGTWFKQDVDELKRMSVIAAMGMTTSTKICKDGTYYLTARINCMKSADGTQSTWWHRTTFLSLSLIG
jgi:hypothetical protein